MRSKFVVRARILSGVFIFIALLLTARLYFLQVVRGDEYREDASAQYVVDTGSQITDRGDIFFTKRDGTPVAGAVMQSGWRVAIAPKNITDANQIFEVISAEATVDQERFFASAAKTNDPYEEVAFRLSDPAASNIRTKKLPGVVLVRDQWRYYPAGELAAHALGFVGFQGDKRVGVYGLERFWETTLSRTSSGMYVNPFAEIFMNLEAAFSDPASQAGSIITTIEPLVETRLEETLDGVMDSYSPKFAGGIIMDPKTGAILAMGARPAFDPNTYNTVSDSSVYTNLLVEGIYEMGSIMKPLTMAAAIDSGAVTPETEYTDRGCIEKSGKTICNFDKKARNRVSMQEVLNQSLNLGVSFAVDEMGHETFGKYVQAYGLGEETGIELPNEAVGNIHAIEDGYDVDYASAGFGQGIAVSAIGMTRALGALANEGVLPSPHIVSAVRLESGITRSVTPSKEGVRVLKPESAQTVTDMLVKVFDDALLKGVLKQEHYSIAAKTGTAQIAMPRGEGYYADRYLHSFFGYFPAHDPKFIVFLFAIEPKGVEFASASLARPFLDITKFLINYYEIPPDR